MPKQKLEIKPVVLSEPSVIKPESLEAHPAIPEVERQFISLLPEKEIEHYAQFVRFRYAVPGYITRLELPKRFVYTEGGRIELTPSQPVSLENSDQYYRSFQSVSKKLGGPSGPYALSGALAARIAIESFETEFPFDITSNQRYIGLKTAGSRLLKLPDKTERIESRFSSGTLTAIDSIDSSINRPTDLSVALHELDRAVREAAFLDNRDELIRWSRTLRNSALIGFAVYLNARARLTNQVGATETVHESNEFADIVHEIYSDLSHSDSRRRGQAWRAVKRVALAELDKIVDALTAQGDPLGSEYKKLRDALAQYELGNDIDALYYSAVLAPYPIDSSDLARAAPPVVHSVVSRDYLVRWQLATRAGYDLSRSGQHGLKGLGLALLSAAENSISYKYQKAYYPLLDYTERLNNFYNQGGNRRFLVPPGQPMRSRPDARGVVHLQLYADPQDATKPAGFHQHYQQMTRDLIQYENEAFNKLFQLLTPKKLREYENRIKEQYFEQRRALQENARQRYLGGDVIDDPEGWKRTPAFQAIRAIYPKSDESDESYFKRLAVNFDAYRPFIENIASAIPEVRRAYDALREVIGESAALRLRTEPSVGTWQRLLEATREVQWTVNPVTRPVWFGSLVWKALTEGSKASREPEKIWQRAHGVVLHELSRIGDASDTLIMGLPIWASKTIYNRVLGGYLPTHSYYFPDLIYPGVVEQWTKEFGTQAELMGLSRPTGEMFAYIIASSADPVSGLLTGALSLASGGLGLVARGGKLLLSGLTVGRGLRSVVNAARFARAAARSARIGEVVHRLHAAKTPLTGALRLASLYGYRNLAFFGDIGDIADAILMGGDITTVLSTLLFDVPHIPTHLKTIREVGLGNWALSPGLSVAGVLPLYRAAQFVALSRRAAREFASLATEAGSNMVGGIYNQLAEPPGEGATVYYYDAPRGRWQNNGILVYEEASPYVETEDGVRFQYAENSFFVPAEEVANQIRLADIGEKSVLGLNMMYRARRGGAPYVPIELFERYGLGQETVRVLNELGFVEEEQQTDSVRLTPVGESFSKMLANPSVGEARNLFKTLIQNEIDARIETMAYRRLLGEISTREYTRMLDAWVTMRNELDRFVDRLEPARAVELARLLTARMIQNAVDYASEEWFRTSARDVVHRALNAVNRVLDIPARKKRQVVLRTGTKVHFDFEPSQIWFDISELDDNETDTLEHILSMISANYDAPFHTVVLKSFKFYDASNRLRKYGQLLGIIPTPGRERETQEIVADIMSRKIWDATRGLVPSVFRALHAGTSRGVLTRELGDMILRRARALFERQVPTRVEFVRQLRFVEPETAKELGARLGLALPEPARPATEPAAEPRLSWEGYRRHPAPEGRIRRLIHALGSLFSSTGISKQLVRVLGGGVAQIVEETLERYRYHQSLAEGYRRVRRLLQPNTEPPALDPNAIPEAIERLNAVQERIGTLFEPNDPIVVQAIEQARNYIAATDSKRRQANAVHALIAYLGMLTLLDKSELNEPIILGAIQHTYGKLLDAVTNPKQWALTDYLQWLLERANIDWLKERLGRAYHAVQDAQTRSESEEELIRIWEEHATELAQYIVHELMFPAKNEQTQAAYREKFGELVQEIAQALVDNDPLFFARLLWFVNKHLNPKSERIAELRRVIHFFMTVPDGMTTSESGSEATSGESNIKFISGYAKGISIRTMMEEAIHLFTRRLIRAIGSAMTQPESKVPHRVIERFMLFAGERLWRIANIIRDEPEELGMLALIENAVLNLQRLGQDDYAFPATSTALSITLTQLAHEAAQHLIARYLPHAGTTFETSLRNIVALLAAIDTTRLGDTRATSWEQLFPPPLPKGIPLVHEAYSQIGVATRFSRAALTAHYNLRFAGYTPLPGKYEERVSVLKKLIEHWNEKQDAPYDKNLIEQIADSLAQKVKELRVGGIYPVNVGVGIYYVYITPGGYPPSELKTEHGLLEPEIGIAPQVDPISKHTDANIAQTIFAGLDRVIEEIAALPQSLETGASKFGFDELFARFETVRSVASAISAFGNLRKLYESNTNEEGLKVAQEAWSVQTRLMVAQLLRAYNATTQLGGQPIEIEFPWVDFGLDQKGKKKSIVVQSGVAQISYAGPSDPAIGPQHSDIQYTFVPHANLNQTQQATLPAMASSMPIGTLVYNRRSNEFAVVIDYPDSSGGVGVIPLNRIGHDKTEYTVLSIPPGGATGVNDYNRMGDTLDDIVLFATGANSGSTYSISHAIWHEILIQLRSIELEGTPLHITQETFIHIFDRPHIFHDALTDAVIEEEPEALAEAIEQVIRKLKDARIGSIARPRETPIVVPSTFGTDPDSIYPPLLERLLASVRKLGERVSRAGERKLVRVVNLDKVQQAIAQAEALKLWEYADKLRTDVEQGIGSGNSGLVVAAIEQAYKEVQSRRVPHRPFGITPGRYRLDEMKGTLETIGEPKIHPPTASAADYLGRLLGTAVYETRKGRITKLTRDATNHIIHGISDMLTVHRRRIYSNIHGDDRTVMRARLNRYLEETLRRISDWASAPVDDKVKARLETLMAQLGAAIQEDEETGEMAAGMAGTAISKPESLGGGQPRVTVRESDTRGSIYEPAGLEMVEFWISDTNGKKYLVGIQVILVKAQENRTADIQLVPFAPIDPDGALVAVKSLLSESIVPPVVKRARIADLDLVAFPNGQIYTTTVRSLVGAATRTSHLPKTFDEIRHKLFERGYIIRRLNLGGLTLDTPIAIEHRPGLAKLMREFSITYPYLEHLTALETILVDEKQLRRIINWSQNGRDAFLGRAIFQHIASRVALHITEAAWNYYQKLLAAKSKAQAAQEVKNILDGVFEKWNKIVMFAQSLGTKENLEGIRTAVEGLKGFLNKVEDATAAGGKTDLGSPWGLLATATNLVQALLGSTAPDSVPAVDAAAQSDIAHSAIGLIANIQGLAREVQSRTLQAFGAFRHPTMLPPELAHTALGGVSPGIDSTAPRALGLLDPPQNTAEFNTPNAGRQPQPIMVSVENPERVTRMTHILPPSALSSAPNPLADTLAGGLFYHLFMNTDELAALYGASITKWLFAPYITNGTVDPGFARDVIQNLFFVNMDYDGRDNPSPDAQTPLYKIIVLGQAEWNSLNPREIRTALNQVLALASYLQMLDNDIVNMINHLDTYYPRVRTIPLDLSRQLTELLRRLIAKADGILAAAPSDSDMIDRLNEQAKAILSEATYSDMLNELKMIFAHQNINWENVKNQSDTIHGAIFLLALGAIEINRLGLALWAQDLYAKFGGAILPFTQRVREIMRVYKYSPNEIEEGIRRLAVADGFIHTKLAVYRKKSFTKDDYKAEVPYGAILRLPRLASFPLLSASNADQILQALYRNHSPVNGLLDTDETRGYRLAYAKLVYRRNKDSYSNEAYAEALSAGVELKQNGDTNLLPFAVYFHQGYGATRWLKLEDRTNTQRFFSSARHYDPKEVYTPYDSYMGAAPNALANISRLIYNSDLGILTPSAVLFGSLTMLTTPLAGMIIGPILVALGISSWALAFLTGSLIGTAAMLTRMRLDPNYANIIKTAIGIAYGFRKNDGLLLKTYRIGALTSTLAMLRKRLTQVSYRTDSEAQSKLREEIKRIGDILRKELAEWTGIHAGIRGLTTEIANYVRENFSQIFRFAGVDSLSSTNEEIAKFENARARYNERINRLIDRRTEPNWGETLQQALDQLARAITIKAKTMYQDYVWDNTPLRTIYAVSGLVVLLDLSDHLGTKNMTERDFQVLLRQYLESINENKIVELSEKVYHRIKRYGIRTVPGDLFRTGIDFFVEPSQQEEGESSQQEEGEPKIRHDEIFKVHLLGVQLQSIVNGFYMNIYQATRQMLEDLNAGWNRMQGAERALGSDFATQTTANLGLYRHPAVLNTRSPFWFATAVRILSSTLMFPLGLGSIVVRRALEYALGNTTAGQLAAMKMSALVRGIATLAGLSTIIAPSLGLPTLGAILGVNAVLGNLINLWLLAQGARWLLTTFSPVVSGVYEATTIRSMLHGMKRTPAESLAFGQLSTEEGTELIRANAKHQIREYIYTAVRTAYDIARSSGNDPNPSIVVHSPLTAPINQLTAIARFDTTQWTAVELQEVVDRFRESIGQDKFGINVNQSQGVVQLNLAQGKSITIDEIIDMIARFIAGDHLRPGDSAQKKAKINQGIYRLLNAIWFKVDEIISGLVLGPGAHGFMPPFAETVRQGHWLRLERGFRSTADLDWLVGVTPIQSMPEALGLIQKWVEQDAEAMAWYINPGGTTTTTGTERTTTGTEADPIKKAIEHLVDTYLLNTGTSPNVVALLRGISSENFFEVLYDLRSYPNAMAWSLMLLHLLANHAEQESGRGMLAWPDAEAFISKILPELDYALRELTQPGELTQPDELTQAGQSANYRSTIEPIAGIVRELSERIDRAREANQPNPLTPEEKNRLYWFGRVVRANDLVSSKLRAAYAEALAIRQEMDRSAAGVEGAPDRSTLLGHVADFLAGPIAELVEAIDLLESEIFAAMRGVHSPDDLRLLRELHFKLSYILGNFGYANLRALSFLIGYTSATHTVHYLDQFAETVRMMMLMPRSGSSAYVAAQQGAGADTAWGDVSQEAQTIAAWVDNLNKRIESLWRAFRRALRINAMLSARLNLSFLHPALRTLLSSMLVAANYLFIRFQSVGFLFTGLPDYLRERRAASGTIAQAFNDVRDKMSEEVLEWLVKPHKRQQNFQLLAWLVLMFSLTVPILMCALNLSWDFDSPDDGNRVSARSNCDLRNRASGVGLTITVSKPAREGAAVSYPLQVGFAPSLLVGMLAPVAGITDMGELAEIMAKSPTDALGSSFKQFVVDPTLEMFAKNTPSITLYPAGLISAIGLGLDITRTLSAQRHTVGELDWNNIITGAIRVAMDPLSGATKFEPQYTRFPQVLHEQDWFPGISQLLHVFSNFVVQRGLPLMMQESLKAAGERSWTALDSEEKVVQAIGRVLAGLAGTNIAVRFVESKEEAAAWQNQIAGLPDPNILLVPLEAQRLLAGATAILYQTELGQHTAQMVQADAGFKIVNADKLEPIDFVVSAEGIRVVSPIVAGTIRTEQAETVLRTISGQSKEEIAKSLLPGAYLYHFRNNNITDSGYLIEPHRRILPTQLYAPNKGWMLKERPDEASGDTRRRTASGWRSAIHALTLSYAVDPSGVFDPAEETLLWHHNETEYGGIASLMRVPAVRYEVLNTLKQSLKEVGFAKRFIAEVFRQAGANNQSRTVISSLRFPSIPTDAEFIVQFGENTKVYARDPGNTAYAEFLENVFSNMQTKIWRTIKIGEDRYFIVSIGVQKEGGKPERGYILFRLDSVGNGRHPEVQITPIYSWHGDFVSSGSESERNRVAESLAVALFKDANQLEIGASLGLGLIDVSSTSATGRLLNEYSRRGYAHGFASMQRKLNPASADSILRITEEPRNYRTILQTVPGIEEYLRGALAFADRRRLHAVLNGDDKESLRRLIVLLAIGMSYSEDFDSQGNREGPAFNRQWLAATGLFVPDISPNGFSLSGVDRDGLEDAVNEYLEVVRPMVKALNKDIDPNRTDRLLLLGLALMIANRTNFKQTGVSLLKPSYEAVRAELGYWFELDKEQRRRIANDIANRSGGVGVRPSKPRKILTGGTAIVGD